MDIHITAIFLVGQVAGAVTWHASIDVAVHFFECIQFVQACTRLGHLVTQLVLSLVGTHLHQQEKQHSKNEEQIKHVAVVSLALAKSYFLCCLVHNLCSSGFIGQLVFPFLCCSFYFLLRPASVTIVAISSTKVQCYRR